MKYFFTSFAGNVWKSFSGKNFLWHLVAIVATAIIVLSGFDWYWFVSTRTLPYAFLLFPALIIGSLLPILGLPIMILFGWLTKNSRTRIIAWTLGQAVVIGYIVSSFYKSLTGRIPPPHTILVDISRQFNFGFLKEGIFWGWPSSHTTVAFAMAFALIALYPKNKAVKILAVIYALYIGIGVSLDIHWFSEFIAGAIIGAVIGLTVGKSFKRKFLDEKKNR